jgi:hypothetical protein
MDGKGLTSVAGRYYILRGLSSIPTGLLLVAAGLFNMPPIGDQRVTGRAVIFFWVAVALAAAGYLAVARYYQKNFGRVDPSRKIKVRLAVWTAIAVVAISAGIMLDTQRDLPVTAYGALYGISMLLYYRFIVGLKPYHWVLLGGLALLSLALVWGGFENKVPVAMIAMGVATIGVGLFDHKELVRSIGQARAEMAGDFNASA